MVDPIRSTFKEWSITVDHSLKMSVSEQLQRFHNSKDEQIGYVAVLTLSGFNLRFIPEAKRTEQFCIDAVKNCGSSLEFVPTSFKTVEMCNEAVKNNGKALEFVPQNILTYELCLLAAQNGGLFRDVPAKYYIKEMCKVYIATQNWETIPLIKSASRWTEELCLFAINTDYKNPNRSEYLLNFFPSDCRTENVLLAAVTKRGDSIDCISSDKQTSKICEAAVSNDGMAIRCIAKDKQTPELYMIAVKQNGQALDFIPKLQQTLEMCQIAYKQSPGNLSYIASRFKKHFP